MSYFVSLMFLNIVSRCRSSGVLSNVSETVTISRLNCYARNFSLLSIDTMAAKIAKS